MLLSQATSYLSDSEASSAAGLKPASTSHNSTVSAKTTEVHPSVSEKSSSKPEDDKVLLALQGYSLYKLEAKHQAIVDFLKLSSFSAVFTSADPSIEARVETLCVPPKNVLNALKADQRLPSKWSASWCAQFILDVVTLIEDDTAASTQSDLCRKSPRKSSKQSCTNSSLPTAACNLVAMVEKARVKVQNDKMTYASKKRKGSSVKTVNDYLLKNRGKDNSDFVEVTVEQIEEQLLCPLCNHRSLISITTKEEADKANKHTMKVYEARLEEWILNGKTGTKPRMARTESQVLGCVCYMQNCIGNTDGSGCFKCKIDAGTNDCTRYVLIFVFTMTLNCGAAKWLTLFFPAFPRQMGAHVPFVFASVMPLSGVTSCSPFILPSILQNAKKIRLQLQHHCMQIQHQQSVSSLL